MLTDVVRVRTACIVNWDGTRVAIGATCRITNCVERTVALTGQIASTVVATAGMEVNVAPADTAIRK